MKNQLKTTLMLVLVAAAAAQGEQAKPASPNPNKNAVTRPVTIQAFYEVDLYESVYYDLTGPGVFTFWDQYGPET